MSAARTSHGGRSRIWIAVAVSVVWLACPVQLSAAAPDLEASALRIEGKLMAPCCMTNTVDEHYSAVSFEMRDDIRTMLGAGRSEQEILEHYVAKYGDQILSAPAARGFNLVAYLFPFVLLLAGAGALVMVVRRWTREPAPEPRPVESAVVEPEQAERLRRALQEFDSAN